MEHQKTQFHYQTIEEYCDQKKDLENEISKIERKITEKIHLLEDFKKENISIEQKVRSYKTKANRCIFLEIIMLLIIIIGLFGGMNLFVFISVLLGGAIFPIKTLQLGLSLYKEVDNDEYNLEIRRAQLNLKDLETLVDERKRMTTKLETLIHEMNLFVETSNLSSNSYEEEKTFVVPNYSDEAKEVSKEGNEKQEVLMKKRNR